MVSVSCFCVGKELLIGKTMNSNAYWLGARLFGIGMMLDRTLVVTDSLEDISSGLKQLLATRPDFIIVIGGLGPTPDDMTLQGIALAVENGVRLDDEALSLIRQHYANSGRTFEMTPARKKMAMLPEGSVAVRNPVGTAPGVRIERAGTVIFCLPGVPKEMKSMYKSSVHKEIRKKVGKLFTSKVVMHLTNVYESTIAPWTSQALKEHPSAYIKSHPKGARGGQSRVELDIVVVGPKKDQAESEREAIAAFFRDKIKEASGIIERATVSTLGR